MHPQDAQLRLTMEDLPAFYQKMQRNWDTWQQQLQNLKGQSEEFVKAIEQVLPSLVSVYTIDWETKEELASGNGFFVAPDVIITNYQVVSAVAEEDSLLEEEESEVVLVVTALRELRLAEVVFTGNSEEDLAVLFITDFILDPEGGEERESPQEYPPLELTFNTQIGEPVIAVGSPLSEFTSAVSLGEITAIFQLDEGEKYNKVNGGTIEVLELQTTAKIHPGNSGGPLINIAGQVVGVNVYSEEAAGVNQAISAEFLDEFLSTFEESFEGGGEENFE